MRFVLFGAMFALPIVELTLLISIGQSIGFWWTMTIIIGTAALGIYVLQTQGFEVIRRSFEALNAGRPPIGPVIDGTFLMLAGLLLITPGFIADTIGLLLLIPSLRHRAAALAVRVARRFGKFNIDIFQSRTAGGKTTEGRGFGGFSGQTRQPPRNAGRGGATPGDGPIIDGEFERLDERTVDPNRRPTPPRGGSGMHRARSDMESDIEQRRRWG